MNKRATLLAASALFLAPSALPSAGAESREERFKRNDLNGNDYIGHAEYETALRKTFDEMDRNHDGTVDLSEYEAFYARQAAEANPKGAAPVPAQTLQSIAACAILTFRGKPGDSFTFEDYRAFQNKVFDVLDRNHDDRLTLDEIKTPPAPGSLPTPICY